MNNKIKLLISIALPLLVGFVAGRFTMPVIGGWYAGLVKPALNPPAWVFGPVWTTLYVLMGIALYLVWREKVSVKKYLGIWFFFIQLGLNFLWSILFFALQSPGTALVDIVFLWFSILATMLIFKKVSQVAFWLMLPYILWVTFAVYLNYSIYALN